MNNPECIAPACSSHLQGTFPVTDRASHTCKVPFLSRIVRVTLARDLSCHGAHAFSQTKGGQRAGRKPRAALGSVPSIRLRSGGGGGGGGGGGWGQTCVRVQEREQGICRQQVEGEDKEEARRTDVIAGPATSKCAHATPFSTKCSRKAAAVHEPPHREDPIEFRSA